MPDFGTRQPLDFITLSHLSFWWDIVQVFLIDNFLC